MNEQLKKGVLDGFVLAFIKRNDAYGYKLVHNFLPLVDISESTLYPILRRLEKQGCLTTYKLKYKGRIRKYYRVTPKGEKKLEQDYVDFNKLKYIFDTLIKRIDKK